jgi:hypothetical protein
MTDQRVTPEGNETGSNMDDQATVAAAIDKPWLFQRGNSAYAQRRQRIEAKAEELAREYDVTSASAKALVRLAAQHLDTAQQARNNTQAARHTRLGLKVLASLKRHEPAAPSLRQLLAGEAAS